MFGYLFRGRNPGWDRHGRMRFLADRKPDRHSARLSGIDPAVADKALEIIWRAFDIPKSQRYCLRPHDDLLALYHSIYPPGWPDCMDFETLWLLLERALGRSLSRADRESATTVGGVMRLLAGPLG